MPVWVESFKDWFRWNPYSTATADNIIYCNPTINGTNSGRFQRVGIPAPEWMLQMNWFIDPLTGNDENDALTAATALASDQERQRRMGPNPQYALGEYHFRYVTDCDNVHVAGEPAPGNTSAGIVIVLHGNATGSQTGKTTLFSGAFDTLVAQAPTANPTLGSVGTPYQATANALSTSDGWTALLFKRIRTSAGLKVWAVKDLGSKTARLCDTMNSTQYAALPISAPTTSPALTLNDTFVVEDLVQIRILRISTKTRHIGISVIVDSLKCGRRDAVAGSVNFLTGCGIVFDGCEIWDPSISFQHGKPSVSVLGCFITSSGSGVNWPVTAGNTFRAGCCNKNMTYFGPENLGTTGLTFRNNFMFQGGHPVPCSGVMRVESLAVFDDTPSQIGIQAAGAQIQLGAGAGFTLWGGPFQWVLFTNFGSSINSDGQVATMATGSISDFTLSGDTSVRPYDPTTGTYLTAQPLTFAKLTAATGSGGFGGGVVNPKNGSRWQMG